MCVRVCKNIGQPVLMASSFMSHICLKCHKWGDEWADEDDNASSHHMARQGKWQGGNYGFASQYWAKKMYLPAAIHTFVHICDMGVLKLFSIK